MSEPTPLHGETNLVLTKFCHDLTDFVYEQAEAHQLNNIEVLGAIRSVMAQFEIVNVVSVFEDE